MPIPSYLDVLNNAKHWRDKNAREDLLKAEKTLRAGMEEYDDSLPLGDELVLVLMKLGDLDGAIAELRELERRFRQVGEETLCRWGSVLKLRARQALSAGGLGAAEMDFRESERYYARAYEEHHTFYPRINELTLRFVRAGLARQADERSKSATLLRGVEEAAKAMLADAIMWRSRKPDDNVWAPASRGEACLLLRRWKESEAAYAEAMHAAGDQKFYYDCMIEQIRDVLKPAFKRLSIPFEGPLDNPEQFFTQPGIA